MNNMLAISSLFCAQLGFGTALTLPFFPVAIAGRSFARFAFGFVLFFLGLFVFGLIRLNHFQMNIIPALLLAGWLFFLTFIPGQEKLESWLTKVFAVFSGVFLILASQRLFAHGDSFASNIGEAVMLLISSAFLAGSLMTMIFGHWYLINRQLPIQYLIKTCKLLLILTYVRIAATAIAIAWAAKTADGDAFTRLTDVMTGHGIFFWARISVGLCVPLLASHLAYSSAKIGSNQSATGILYAGVIFVLMGEILALYLAALAGYLF